VYPQRSYSPGSPTRILRAPRAASCLDDDDVAAFLHGRLPPARIRVLDEHVAACRDCRELLSALAAGKTLDSPAAPDAPVARGSDAQLTYAVAAGSSDTAPWMSGDRTLGAYHLLGMLGAGGMGTVYLAEHTLLGRRAAIKVVLPSLSEDDAIIERFFHEARMASQIADPGIVQVFDYGHRSDGTAFIVMELLEGEALDQRLARIGRFDALACLRLVRLICASLAAVHARGIVHRDLKPANIFLVDDPAVPGGERTKLLDFGIAKLIEDDTAAVRTWRGTAMGTPAYMAPEQSDGRGGVDHRADIYALGCVMFAMLTGRPPFDGTSAAELIALHLCAPPPLASSRVPALPGVIDRILQRCLCKSADQRFASIAELTQALDAAEQALRAPPSPRPGRRRARAGAAIALAIAAVVAVGALRGARSPESSGAPASIATPVTARRASPPPPAPVASHVAQTAPITAAPIAPAAAAAVPPPINEPTDLAARSPHGSEPGRTHRSARSARATGDAALLRVDRTD
jgi:serine/threonine protein kinase